MIKMKDKEKLFRSISSKDVLLFIGAGFSIPCGLPSGNDLKKLLADKLHKHTGSRMHDLPLQDISDTLKNELGDEEFIKLLSSYFLIPSKDTSSHDLLASIPFFDNIVTTNYETYLEDAFGDRCFVKISNDDLVERDKNRVCIYKIHGDFSQPDKIVITKSDYARFSNNTNNLIWNEVKGLMSKKIVLFVGYSIDDIHVYNYLFEVTTRTSMIDEKYRHAYYVAPKLTKEQKALLRSRKIIPINSTGKKFFEDLDNFLKKNIVSSYKKKETDKSSFSDYMALKNISFDMDSHNQTLANFKPVDNLKPFDRKFCFTLEASSLDSKDLQKAGIVTEEGGLRIPAENLHGFKEIINNIETMNQDDITYIEMLPKIKKCDVRFTNSNRKVVLYRNAGCYTHGFDAFDVRFVMKRQLYTIKIDNDISNDDLSSNLTLGFEEVDSDYIGLWEELKELVALTETTNGVFNININGKSMELEFDLSHLSKIVKEAVTYYSCLRKLTLEKNLPIDKFPVFSRENSVETFLLYSYYFKKALNGTLLYDSDNLNFSTLLTPLPGVDDIIEDLNSNQKAFRLMGEKKDFSFTNIKLKNIHSCLIIKNNIKQKINKESLEVYKLEITAKTSDYIFIFADSEEQFDLIISNSSNILDSESFFNEVNLMGVN